MILIVDKTWLQILDKIAAVASKPSSMVGDLIKKAIFVDRIALRGEQSLWIFSWWQYLASL